MEEERLISQGSKRAFPADAEDPAVAAAPPPGHALIDPASSFDDGYAILGLPAPSSYGYGSVLGDDDDSGEAYDDMSNDDGSSDSEGIKMTTSAAEEPVVAGSSYVAVGDDVVDGGGAVDPPPSLEDGRDNEGAVLGDEEDDLTDDEDDDTDDEDVDSEFEDDDEVPKVVKNSEVLAGPCKFLGQPAGIASVHSTVCFMKIAPYTAQCQCHHGGGGQIIVEYRYTRFFRTQQSGGGDDGDGVDMCFLGPKQARLRFVLGSPLASDPATTTTSTTVSSSLRFAGAVLASLVYPARFSAQLQALWSVATVPVVRVPARATCLLVTVDAGILRPGDCTPARMMRMCNALASVARDRAALPPSPFDFDIVTQLRLPALLGSEDDVRPTKRRRVTGEDCPICFELLEEGEGLAAWPRCSHIFHGGCLEQHLLRGYQECPLCRSELKLS